MENNNGTIMNLNMIIADGGLTFTGVATKINIAPIAINNNGLIYNVSVAGAIVATPSKNEKQNDSTTVAGVALDNYGQISKATVTASISTLDDSKNFATMAGGITRNNYGTIEYSTYSGTIQANTVGGISVRNYGGIEACAVTQEATIIVTDRTNTQNFSKGMTGGGITAVMDSGVSEVHSTVYIKQSYSLATIRINKVGSGLGYIVSGFVGSINEDANAVIANNYVVANIISDSSNMTQGEGVQVHYMLESNSLRNVTNNYYIKTATTTVSDTNSRNDVGCKLLSSKTELDAKMSSLLDGNDQNLFDTYPNNVDRYPSIKVLKDFGAFEQEIYDNLLAKETNR
jgi:hypothetical protein